MGIISRLYIKNVVYRYDKEVGVPYYSYLDFKGLKQEAFTFKNNKGLEIHYFYYYYDNYLKDKVVVFLHGLAAGHAAYLAEIEALAKRGYKVLTLDFQGCGESQGKYLGSVLNPTSDLMELLDLLNLKKEIILVGHSMGAFTALNVINLRKEIKKAVIISGFLSVDLAINVVIKSKFVAKRLIKYERKQQPKYYLIDNIEYLKNTDDKLLFLHSKDDAVLNYDIGVGLVNTIDNPHLETWTFTNRKHNPNYTDAAVSYMNDVFGKYYQLIREKKIKTDEEKIAYFKDVSLAKLVEQDDNVFNKIKEFIEK